ncbi:helix-turn-helix domain-containing protein [Rubrivivax sp. RP6-9]|uniref:helix-turn-helix domain-containing protein n=1 Tax=Rubrivivax sp. RP6-9 TaxID=3415750 RepID=UPI003CC64922
MSTMPNLATVLKAEVARLARKELRAETEALKRTVASQRAEIAALKRRTAEVEKVLKTVLGVAEKARAKPAVPDTESSDFRFRASGMASNRKRLGLSAEDFGALVGATGQSVYSWEAGKTKPRAKSLAAIAALRGVGKREVAKRLEALKQG